NLLEVTYSTNHGSDRKQVGCEWGLSTGVRYSHIDQFFSSTLTSMAGSTHLESKQRFTGVGVTAAGVWWWHVPMPEGSQYQAHFFSRLRGSALVGSNERASVY